MEGLILSPTDFVAVFNQTIGIAYPQVTIEGEVSNYRIAKGKWVYFDIKDEYSSLRVFGSVFQLKHAIDNGMLVRLTARPELHPLYNFSLQMVEVLPSGEGSIKKSFDILLAKMEAEGLFDISRKRPLPYPPERVALITSDEAAAYGDFIKVLNARWPLLSVELANVRVQGEMAASEITTALHRFNLEAVPAEVIVIIRGGGSAEDLLAFQDEQLTRAIAESRIPTLVAIGHERDVSLAELAADLRASTPSNAAELLVPKKDEVLRSFYDQLSRTREIALNLCQGRKSELSETKMRLSQELKQRVINEKHDLKHLKSTMTAFDPRAILARGYSVTRLKGGQVLKSIKQIKISEELNITLSDGEVKSRVIG